MEKLEGGGCESGGDLQDMVRQAIEDVVREQIGGGAEDGGCANNGSASSASESSASSGVQSTFDRMKDMAFDDANNEVEKEQKNSDKKCSNSGGGDNWLVALAKAMSEIQNEHLTKMLGAQKEMQKNVGESKESREKFIEAQSKFQAESKLFGMASECTATALKTIGDAMSSIARKQ
jgi:hypothetical protein